MQKFVVFCRASSLINNLPKHYLSSENKNEENDYFFRTHIVSDTAGLVILKLNAFHSQQLFVDEIINFFRDHILNKLILVIDMKESSPDGINHIRMIIEEVEQSNMKAHKDIFLLLHFPSYMFSSGIYPSLFLHGWNYRYIDSLAHQAEPGVIDIKLWMMETVKCVSHSYFNFASTELKLQKLIEGELKTLAADFSSTEYITEDGIQKILCRRPITLLLCSKFLKEYFEVNLYTQYLNDAAYSIQQRESAISMKIQIY